MGARKRNHILLFMTRLFLESNILPDFRPFITPTTALSSHIPAMLHHSQGCLTECETTGRLWLLMRHRTELCFIISVFDCSPWGRHSRVQWLLRHTKYQNWTGVHGLKPNCSGTHDGKPLCNHPPFCDRCIVFSGQDHVGQLNYTPWEQFHQESEAGDAVSAVQHWCLPTSIAEFYTIVLAWQNILTQSATTLWLQIANCTMYNIILHT